MSIDEGLAEDAILHGDHFDRMHAVVKNDGNLMALDLKSEAVRQAVAKVGDGGVRKLFEDLGGSYN